MSTDELREKDISCDRRMTDWVGAHLESLDGNNPASGP